MNIQHFTLVIGLVFSCPAWAEDLALPVQNTTTTTVEAAPTLAPNIIIRPPTHGLVTVAPVSKAKTAEMTILELERQLIATQARRQIAEAQTKGGAAELKQLILISGPMDTAISNAPTPPASSTEDRVAMIGLPSNEKATKSLEGFFGAPLTPEREKKLLDTVRSQFASSKEMKDMEVRIAGWWPEKGVMALSVTMKGS